MPWPTDLEPMFESFPCAHFAAAAPQRAALQQTHGVASVAGHKVGDLNDFDRLSPATKARIEAGVARFLSGEGRGTSE